MLVHDAATAGGVVVVIMVTLIHRQPKQLNLKTMKTYVRVIVLVLVTNPTGTYLVLVLVTVGAVTVTTEALEMPL